MHDAVTRTTLPATGTLYCDIDDEQGEIVDLVPTLRILPGRWIQSLHEAEWTLTEETTSYSDICEENEQPDTKGYVCWKHILKGLPIGDKRRRLWATPTASLRADSTQVLIWLATYRYGEFLRLIASQMDDVISSEAEMAFERIHAAALLAFPEVPFSASTQEQDVHARQYSDFVSRASPFPEQSDEGAEIVSVPWLLSGRERASGIILEALGYHVDEPHFILSLTEDQEQILYSWAGKASKDMAELFTESLRYRHRKKQLQYEKPSALRGLWSYIFGEDSADLHRMDFATAAIYEACKTSPVDARESDKRRSLQDITNLEGLRLVTALTGSSYELIATTPAKKNLTPIQVPDGRFNTVPLITNSVPRIRGYWYHQDDFIGSPVDLTTAVALLGPIARRLFWFNNWKITYGTAGTLAPNGLPECNDWGAFCSELSHNSQRLTPWRPGDSLMACPSDALQWYEANHRGGLLSYVFESLRANQHRKRSEGMRAGPLLPYSDTLVPRSADMTPITDMIKLLSNPSWVIAQTYEAVNLNARQFDQWDIPPAEVRHVRTIIANLLSDLRGHLYDIALDQAPYDDPFSWERPPNVVQLFPFLCGSSSNDRRFMSPSRASDYHRHGYTAPQARAIEFGDSDAQSE